MGIFDETDDYGTNSDERGTENNRTRKTFIESDTGSRGYMEREKNNSRLISLMLIPVEEEFDMAHRPYDVHMNPGDVDVVMDIVDRNKFKNKRSGDNLNPFSPTSMAHNLPGMMRSSDMPHSVPLIDNGWREPRFKFILIVESVSKGVGDIGDIYTSYVQGWTDRDSGRIVTTTKSVIDEDTLFYINNVFTTRTTQPYKGVAGVTHVIGSIDVIKNRYGVYTFRNDREALRLFRPSDIVGEIADMSNMGLFRYGDDTQFTPISSRYTGESQPSLTAYKHGVEHASKVLNAFYRISTNSGMGAEEDLYATGVAYSNEMRLNQIPFIKLLSSSLNTDDYNPTSFTMGNIIDLFPNADDNTYISERINTAMYCKHITNMEANPIGVVDIRARMANDISNAISAAMNKPPMMLSKVTLEISNMNRGMRTVVRIIDYGSYVQNIDLTRMVDKLQIQIEDFIFPDITANGEYIMSIMVDIDLLGGTSVIAIDLDGLGKKAFPISSYASSLFSPILMPAEAQIQGKQAFSKLADTLFSEI